MATLFLHSPRLTILVIGLIAVAGISSFAVLPRMEDPILAERAALVLTSMPGADADLVEALVTEPIEDELRDIAEIKELRSSSRMSLSTMTIELRDDVRRHQTANIWSRIRDRLADAEARLPPDASKPRFERIEVTAFTRLIALLPRSTVVTNTNPDRHSLHSAELAILRRHAEDLREQLLAVPGTKDVQIFGAPREEILVEADQDLLAAAGLTIADVSRAAAASDARISAGVVRGTGSNLLVEVSGKLTTVARVAAIPLQSGPQGQRLTIGDVATVRRSCKQPPDELTMVRGSSAIVLACLVQNNRRIDHWHAASSQITDQFRARYSRSIDVVDVFSQAVYVNERFQTLMTNLLIGAVSVFAVVMLMMGVRSALIVGVALPLSAFMVLAGMRWAQIPIHQMSVTGLIIALGLLIDNAIVVVDEVGRKLRQGAGAVQAVQRTVAHLAVPLLGSTLTTALAFGPIALMPGPAGEFVGSIAVNVIVAIFSSLFIAMTIVPALLAFVSQRRTGGLPTEDPTDLHMPTTGVSWRDHGWSHPGLTRAYRRILSVIIARPVTGIVGGLILPLAGFAAATTLPEQFFPPADRDQITVELDLPSHASIDQTWTTAAAIRDRLKQTGIVRDVTWWIGRSAPPFYYNQIPGRRNQPQYAQALVRLNVDRNLRPHIRRLQRELDAAFPEARILVRQLEQGPPFDAPIEVEVFGPDLQKLTQFSHEIRRVLADLPQVTHIRAEITETQPRLKLAVDEKQARLVGLRHQDIAQQTYAMLEGTTGGLILEETEDLPIRVRTAHNIRSRLEAIETLPLVVPASAETNQQRSVPLMAIAKPELKAAQASVTRQNRERVTIVQAWLEAGVLPAPVLEETRRRLEQAELQLPPGYRLEFGGESAQRNDAIGNLLANVGILAVLMITSLVMSFRSFRLAALIGCVALLSVGLGLGALWLFGYPFGFMAIIGTMGLIGVAINDSIVVLAAIRADEAAKRGDPQQIELIVTLATRHVVATSLTTMAGFLPLILGGGSFWPPLAVTIGGGVGGATILAIVFVPACYRLMYGRHQPTTA